MRIDFHSHILPGIDDGSRSVTESVAMLKMTAAQGIGHMVATPHFYANSDSMNEFLRKRQEAESQLREEMEKHAELPEITVGAEVYYFRGMSKADILSGLTIGNTPFLLLEMPASPWTDTMFREIEQIYIKQEIVPVIAHIDRYISAFRSYGIPERLQEMPVLVQANAGFFLKRGTRAKAMRMLQRNQIHLLGSDCHNTSTRLPNLGPVYQMVAERLGAETAAGIDACGSQVLAGSFDALINVI